MFSGLFERVEWPGGGGAWDVPQEHPPPPPSKPMLETWYSHYIWYTYSYNCSLLENLKKIWMSAFFLNYKILLMALISVYSDAGNLELPGGWRNSSRYRSFSSLGNDHGTEDFVGNSESSRYRIVDQGFNFFFSR